MRATVERTPPNILPKLLEREGRRSNLWRPFGRRHRLLRALREPSIKADIELIRPEQINRAYERVVNKDVRYRFVIDMTA